MNPFEAEIISGVTSSMVGVIIFSALISLVSLAGSFFLAFCVYYDALRHRDNNAVLWGVLSGFFNIVALVYIIVKNSKQNQPKRCVRCGNFLPLGSVFCACCGLPHAQEPLPPELDERYAKRSRLHLILWIISIVLTIILACILFVVFFVQIMDLAQYGMEYGTEYNFNY